MNFEAKEQRRRKRRLWIAISLLIALGAYAALVYPVIRAVKDAKAKESPMTISNAVKIASGLHVGMPGADVSKYVEDHGLVQTNVYSFSMDRGRTLTYPYRLAGTASLMLEMHCTSAPPG